MTLGKRWCRHRCVAAVSKREDGGRLSRLPVEGGPGVLWFIVLLQLRRRTVTERAVRCEARSQLQVVGAESPRDGQETRRKYV